jgi:parallel beta-helix repeat protein
MNKYKVVLFTITIIFFNNFFAFSSTWPIQSGQSNAPLTSSFGPRWLSPSEVYDFHFGNDIRNMFDDNVVAAHDGYADWIGNNASYETMIFVGEDNYDYATGYAHLTNVLVQIGTILQTGTLIAECTYPTSHHLHFNYYTSNIWSLYYGNHPMDDDTVNPMNFLPFYSSILEISDPEVDIDNDGTYIKIETEIGAEELDFDRLSIYVTGRDNNGIFYWTDEILAGTGIDNSVVFDDRLNCSIGKKLPQYPIVNEIKIITQNFSPPNNQHLEFRFYVNQSIWNILENADTYALLEDLEGHWVQSNTVNLITGFHPPPGAPAPPTGLIASSNSSDMTVDLEWDEHPDPSVLYYVVYRRPEYTNNPEDARVIGISYLNSFKDDYQTTPGLEYYYSVAAINEKGEGFNSSEYLAEMPSDGNITSNRVWIGNGVLSGDVVLNEGIRLTIHKDTELKFEEDVRLIINGYLDVQGTAEEPVIFTSNQPSPSKGDWSGIRFNDSSDDNSIINYATITYATKGVEIHHASPTIENCTIDQSSQYGLYLYYSNAKITNNDIVHSQSNGIHLDFSSPEMLNNNIHGNYHGVVANQSSPILGIGPLVADGYNEISGNNGIGIYAVSSSRVKMGEGGDCIDCHYAPAYNSVYANAESCAECHGGAREIHLMAHMESEIKAELNWWGTPEPDESAFISDGGSWIDYIPWLNSQPESENIPKKHLFIASESKLKNEIPNHNFLSDLNLANFYTETGDHASAIELLKKMVDDQQQPKVSQTILQQLSECSKHTMNFDMKEYLSNIIAENPNTPLSKVAYQLFIEHYIYDGYPEKALELCDEIISRFDNDHDLISFARSTSSLIYINEFDDPQKGYEILKNIEQMSLNQSNCPDHTIVNHLRSLLNLAPKTTGSVFAAGVNSNILAPQRYALNQNYPNPFNPNTHIEFSIPTTCQVSLKIYNLFGETIATLVNEYKDPGTYQVSWNGRNHFGTPVASGIYFYKLEAERYIAQKKMILLK